VHSWASHDRLMHDPTALQEVQKDLSHLSQGQTSMLGSSPSSNAWHRLQVILCAGLALVSRILQNIMSHRLEDSRRPPRRGGRRRS